MSQELLDRFGKLLMTRVRDKSITEWEKILSGQMKDAGSEVIRKQTEVFGPEQMQIFLRILPEIVDTTLHYLLWAVEQERSVDIVAKDVNGVARSLREVSDGLAGELYSEQGWIARFSGKPKVRLE